MKASRYYNEKYASARVLDEGSGVRNSHNFIKAVLIQQFVEPNKRILDLGCGQGGDLSKLKHVKPSIYVGIDVSSTAITCAQSRASKLLRCRTHFLCVDFTENKWSGYPPYDVINCQFAIHFAFESVQKANFTLGRISNVLRNGGFFIGSVPRHSNKSTYDQVVVRLPDDDREYVEYAVEMTDLVQKCKDFELDLILFDSFDVFYNKAKFNYAHLCEKMHANSLPDSNNSVFCFQKNIRKKIES
jgi:SAM-dependent methyltransferase